MFILALGLIISGCSASPSATTAPAPSVVVATTSTPTPTELPPTSTSTPLPPTSTPVPPTPTPTSTSTPTINLDPISKYLTNASVTQEDWFDTLSSDNWDCGNGAFHVTDGMLIVQGGNSSCNRLTTFQEGTGTLISFKLAKDSNFEYFFDDRLSQWGTSSYKRFGIATGPRNGTEASIWNGKTWVGARLQSPKPEIWYNLLVAIGKGPKFLLLVWERDNPTKQIIYSRQIPQYHNAEWKLQINSFYGTVQFDNYAEISFSDMK